MNCNHTGAFSTGAAIIGKVAITKSGAGTTTLSGANTYTGATTVNGGTLALGNYSGIAASLSGNGGALNVSGSLATAGVHVGENGYTGAMSVSGALTASSFLTVGDNTGAPGVGGTGALTIANGGVVTLGSGARLTGGWLNAAGSLDVQSGGRLEIGGTNGLQKNAARC